MEHIALSHMANHLSSNDILIDEQDGFRQRFSCETQLISAIHNWAKLINVHSQTDVVLLDFSKAFDSVPHQRLLLKLDYYGIRGNMLKSIKAFLTNRPQSVSINGVQSSTKPVLSGVPQGSNLGPVLFLLYINDISSSVKSSLRLFADDVSRNGLLFWIKFHITYENKRLCFQLPLININIYAELSACHLEALGERGLESCTLRCC